MFAPEQTLWITLSFTDPGGWAAPIAGGSYTGNPDGSWYRFSGSSTGWDVYHPISGYYTWLIRAVLTNTTDIEENAAENTDFAFISDGQLIINGEGYLQVFDVLGHQLFSKELSAPLSSLNLSHIPSGVYLLRLINGKNIRIQKIVKHL